MTCEGATPSGNGGSAVGIRCLPALSSLGPTTTNRKRKVKVILRILACLFFKGLQA